MKRVWVSPKQTVRNVESALLAQLGMRVSHKKISVATSDEGHRAGRGGLHLPGAGDEHDSDGGSADQCPYLANDADDCHVRWAEENLVLEERWVEVLTVPGSASH